MTSDQPEEDPTQSWREIRRFFMTFNLRRIVEYHNSVLGMVLREAEELDPAQPSLVEWYRDTNATNTLLLLAAYLEEMLGLRWKAKRMAGDPDPGLKGFKPVLEGFVSRPAWATLVDAFLIRNCVLHQNRRLDLLAGKKRSALERIVSNHQGTLEVRNKRLRVSPEHVRIVVEAAYELTDWVSEEPLR